MPAAVSGPVFYLMNCKHPVQLPSTCGERCSQRRASCNRRELLSLSRLQAARLCRPPLEAARPLHASACVPKVSPSPSGLWVPPSASLRPGPPQTHGDRAGGGGRGPLGVPGAQPSPAPGGAAPSVTRPPLPPSGRSYVRL